MEPRRGDRRVGVHAEIDQVHQRFEHGGDDPRASGTADHKDRTTVLFDDRRGHRRQGTLGRRDRVGRALHEAKHIGRGRSDREIVHLVVE
jgi:hypothetical protein